MFLPKELDLHRLEEVTRRILKGLPLERRNGRTLAYLYMMKGEVELGAWGNKYLYVTDNSDLARSALREFAELLKREYSAYGDGIEVDINRGRLLFLGGLMFEFIGAPQFTEPQRIRGRTYDRVFFDVSGDTQWELDRNGDLMAAMETLRQLGADFV